MSSIKDLIEQLSIYNQDAEITNEQNEPFIHMVNLNDGSLILSTKKPIGICNRSGGYVYPSFVNSYSGFCPELDEDLYDFEFEKIDHKKFLEENSGE